MNFTKRPPGLSTGGITPRKRTADRTTMTSLRTNGMQERHISLPDRENHEKEWTRYQGFSFPLYYDSRGNGQEKNRYPSHSIGKTRADEMSEQNFKAILYHSATIHREWARKEPISFPLEREPRKGLNPILLNQQNELMMRVERKSKEMFPTRPQFRVGKKRTDIFPTRQAGTGLEGRK